MPKYNLDEEIDSIFYDDYEEDPIYDDFKLNEDSDY